MSPLDWRRTGSKWRSLPSRRNSLAGLSAACSRVRQTSGSTRRVLFVSGCGNEVSRQTLCSSGKDRKNLERVPPGLVEIDSTRVSRRLVSLVGLASGQSNTGLGLACLERMIKKLEESCRTESFDPLERKLALVRHSAG